ncbi:MAG: hypothetical protein QM638_20590 [Nocardioides sp.]|uniref:hypothetical protein n=1 Tax=Nocardioides sp. TaxID=35761 RepID=UPI0039E3942F
MQIARTVIGRYPHTARLRSGEVSPRSVRLEFIDVDPVHEAFGDMIEHQRYDLCEMAVGAFLQARAAGKPLWLLPVVTLARPQHGSLYVDPRAGVAGPADLAGRRVAVRSYSQTTGLWVRGILEQEYGLDLGAVTWVTTEPAHLAGFVDPAQAVRAPAGSSVLGLLRQRQVDAAIHAPGQPVTDWCRPLIADHEVAARRYAERLGATPINHLMCVGPRIGEDAGLVGDLHQAFTRCARVDGRVPPDRKALLDPARIVPVIERALTMAQGQGLLESRGLLAEGLDPDGFFAAGCRPARATR